MPHNAIYNIRGFFSDYWLGSVLSAKKSAGPRLTAAQARKKLWRLNQLHERVDSVEPPDVTPFREKFARPLLDEILGFSLLEGEDARLRLIAANGAPAAAALLCPDQEQLESRQTRQQLERVLLEKNLPYGFIISPGTVRLIRKPGDGAAKAAFDFSIATAVETNDLDSLAIAYRVLSAENFIRQDGAPAPIELLEEESRKHSARVSDDLKEAVFVSAELLIRGFLEDLRVRPREPEPSLIELRDTALQTLYRLLFVLYAESRDERLQTHTLYRDSYSLEILLARLLNTREEELAGNRFGLWSQLLALFEVYDQGMLDIPGLENIPPRGGTLFSSETPEGALIAQLRLSDRAVWKLLITLATTRPRRGVGRERVSFRELEIEQLGAVYEGLLEYEPRVAAETMIELRVQGREFVLAPAEVVRLCEQKELQLKGDAAIVEGTAAARLHSDFADENGDEEDDEDAEGEDEKGLKRGATARLIRRLEPGDFYFVPGSARKSSGSFYTREEIVQYLTRNALAGLVEGKTPAEIESLRIIDIACGSAHFLVGAARWLGRVLLDAYRAQHQGEPPPDFYPAFELTAKIREQWERQGEAWCKRRIVEKCLFGVDLNPTAVQLAHVALWIESLAGDRPLSFFRHHVRCGNSLLGTWIDKLHTPPHPDLGERDDREHGGLFERNIRALIARAIDERRLIDEPLPSEVRKDTPEEFEYKADRLTRAEAVLAQARLLFDLRSASAFVPAIWRDWATLLGEENPEAYANQRPWWNEFVAVRKDERFFHWELEFPEVFFGKRGGFDVVLGNPPWDKVLPARSEFYGRRDILIRAYAGNDLDQRIHELHAENAGLEADFEAYQERTRTLATSLRRGGDFPLSRGRTAAAHEDLSKFFLERATQITREGGSIGLLLPSVVYNGDGCAGLREWLLSDASIRCFYGFENRQKIFPIDSRYKFVSLVFRKARSDTASFSAAFMRHDLAELSQPGPHPWEVHFTVEEVRSLSPESFAFLEYRDPRDQEIVGRMYDRSVRLSDETADGWGVTLISWRAHGSIFNTSEDKDLWTDPMTGKLYDPRTLGVTTTGPMTLVEEMNRLGFFPVYEGKHIEQFIFGTKPIRWWLKVEQARAKYAGAAPNDSVLVFRETASNTNQRTCIAAILPPGSAASHTLTAIQATHVDLEAAAAVFNSLCFDYALRFRTAGTHISFTYMEPMPVPPANVTNSLPRVPTINGWTENCQFITDRKDLWAALWNSNRAVAEAYGLNADDFLHILKSFGAVARKRPEFYDFLLQETEAWASGTGEVAVDCET